MLKSKISKLFAILLVLFIGLSCEMFFTQNTVAAICCRKSSFDKSAYSGKLTGDVAKDAAIIATSQDRRTGSQFGYNEGWCDEFVADCLELAGAGSAVKHGGDVADFKSKMKKCGATKVSKANAKVGDLAFASGHVEIIWKISGSTIYTVGGNINLTGGKHNIKTSCVYKRANATGQSYFKFTEIYRPAYPNKKSEVTVKFHRNINSSDTAAVTEKFTEGVSNQRFGYNTDGTGKYKSMNPADVGFGQWINPGYKLLGWSSDKNATTASYKTYCPVVDSWIKSNSPSVNFYAVWQKADLASISVSTPPAAVIYENGSSFNTNGMVVTAKYSNGTTKAVTGYKTTFDFTNTGAANVTVSYTEDGITKTATQAVTVQDIFKGSGTEADPYQISTATDLRNLASQINNLKSSASYYAAHYVQTDDIDLENVNFVPIGRFYESETSTKINFKVIFAGNYNGNYHKIKGLNIDYTYRYTGLFGRTNGNAVVRNLSVEGNVASTDYCVGGIVGEHGYGAKVVNCDFTGTVKGYDYVGGIIGKYQGGASVSECYANAQVTATSEEGYAGGIAGYIYTGNADTAVDAIVEKSYFAGSVNAVHNGGISGGTQIDTVKECTITYRDCYYLETAAKGAVDSQTATGCKPLDSELLRETGASLLKAPFVTADAGVNDGYPVFEWQNISGLKGDVDNNDAVTVADAVMLQKYLVKSAELVNISAGDMDGNGKLNVFDFILIKRELCAVNS